MVAKPLFFLGVPPTLPTHRTLRELVRLIGRTETRRLVASFEANPPAGSKEAFAWVQAAHGDSSVRQVLDRWIRARLNLPASCDPPW